MLFTNGFVLSCVELDVLANLLLDASSGVGRDFGNDMKQNCSEDDNSECEYFHLDDLHVHSIQEFLMFCLGMHFYFNLSTGSLRNTRLFSRNGNGSKRFQT